MWQEIARLLIAWVGIMALVGFWYWVFGSIGTF